MSKSTWFGFFASTDRGQLGAVTSFIEELDSVLVSLELSLARLTMCSVTESGSPSKPTEQIVPTTGRFSSGFSTKAGTEQSA